MSTRSLLVIATLASVLSLGADAGPPPGRASFIVSAHPDDELSTAYGVDHDTFHVYVYLTMGDATVFCTTDQGWEPEKGEVFPAPGSPADGGRYSEHCKDARQYSTIEYLNAAHASGRNPAGPFPRTSAWTPELSAPGMPDDVPRNERGQVLGHTARQAEYHLARNGRGVVIFFDLGDDNLAADEVEWALRAVSANRDRFSVPSDTAAWHGIFANGRAADDVPYSNAGTDYHPGCEPYYHHAHAAVHDALRRDLGTGAPQFAATCATDPERAASAAVDTALHIDDEAPNPTVPFSATDERHAGHYDRHYGWLYHEHIDRSRVTSTVWPEGALYAPRQHYRREAG